MLDLRMIRENPEKVEAGLKTMGDESDIRALLDLDEKHRKNLTKVEHLKSTRNKVSKEIGVLKKNGGGAETLVNEMSELGQQIKALDDINRELEEQIKHILIRIPNLPHDSLPIGPDESYNREEKKWGTPPEFTFPARPHWELGEELGIYDFERASKVTGARFAFYRNQGALLERSLLNFMLDLHTREHGYSEVLPPFIVNSESMFGTGQLPKFKEDIFRLEGLDYYLIPTAEVPVTNLYRNEILDGKDLPFRMCAFSPCFRSEAGAYGRDTRGLIRQHQFNKVELVALVHPDNSYEELERLTENAERVLELLELPYRRITLATGDVGFSAAKTYDLEVWLPAADTYREISSCSNFEDFQARRANIRFRGANGKPNYVHTLNGSGLAIGRTGLAIVENYQQEDGSVKVPKVLQPYMNGMTVIKGPENTD